MQFFSVSENTIDIANWLALLLLEVFLTVLQPTPAAFIIISVVFCGGIFYLLYDLNNPRDVPSLSLQKCQKKAGLNENLNS